MRDPLRILALLGGLLLAAPAVAGDEEPDNRAVNWETFREASERSRREDKPLLLHFTARWSDGAAKMKLKTYADRRVIGYLNEHFAMAQVDTERLPALARKYDVEEWPTLWFLDAAGKPLTRWTGYVDVERLLPLLEFIATQAYLEHDYEDWRKRRS